MPKVSKSKRATKYQTLAKGLRKRLQPGDSLPLAGKSHVVKDVIAELDGMLQEMRKTDAAYAAYQAQVARERVREQKVRVLARNLQRWVSASLGTGPDLVREFALKVGKPGPKTVKGKQAMVEKRGKKR